jgi:hypothetical protein
MRLQPLAGCLSHFKKRRASAGCMGRRICCKHKLQLQHTAVTMDDGQPSTTAVSGGVPSRAPCGLDM